MKIQNLAAATLLALTASNVNATLLDLTTTPNLSGTINQAIFSNAVVQPAGSGVLDSFVRINDNIDVVQGYNTSGSPFGFNEIAGAFTHDLFVNQLGIVTIGGVNYWKFILDINQIGTAAGTLLSLDKVQIYMGAGDGGTPVNNVANLSSLGTLVYDLDAGGDNAIKLQADLNGGGSGTSDLFAYIPVPVLTAANLTQKISLFSQFGATNPFVNNDGFQEWARLSGDTSACIPTVENNFCGSTPPSPAPEPGILALLATALLGFGFKARSKKAD